MQSTKVRVKNNILYKAKSVSRQEEENHVFWLATRTGKRIHLFARDFSLLFVLFLFSFNLNFVLLHANEKTRTSPFPAILTSRLVNNAYKFAQEGQCFTCTLRHHKLGSKFFCFKVTLPRVIKHNPFSRLPSPKASLFRVAKAFRVTWSKPLLRHRSELTERDCENAVQGLGDLPGALQNCFIFVFAFCF